MQYCIHTENHELKKLLMYYWEVVQKYDARGELLPEMILVWYVHVHVRERHIRVCH